MTTEWLMLTSMATSHAVVRGSALMMLSIDRCQLLMASHYAPHVQGSHLLHEISL